MSDEIQSKFTHIYDNDLWGGGRCKSGMGSLLESTNNIRRELPYIFEKLEIKTLADAPCGVGDWLTHITANLQYYFGYDIVVDAVLKRVQNNSALNHFFSIADITDQVLPSVDAILCRDCLVHLSNDLVISALKNFKKSGSKYLIATSYLNEVNKDHNVGGWRATNLSIEPFNLPPPIYSIEEEEGGGKHLCVYQL